MSSADVRYIALTARYLWSKAPPTEVVKRMPVEVFALQGSRSSSAGPSPLWTYFHKFNDALFDRGCPNTANEIARAVGKVRKVLMTHYHEDHVGAAPLLRDSPTLRGHPRERA